MADNRIYLKCEGCGGLLYLGKRLCMTYFWRNYGKDNNSLPVKPPGYVPQDERPLERRLNDFYNAHDICGSDAKDFTFDHFKIVYENDDDFVFKGEGKDGQDNS